MFHKAFVAGVAEAAGELVAEAEVAVRLAQKQHAAVAGQVTAAEIRLHRAFGWLGALEGDSLR